MRIKTTFILIILLLLNINIVDGATDEGYGEDEQALGQFVDSFENGDNISVSHNVILNTTLDCVELNYSGGVPLYESFNDYTEIDTVNNRVVVQNNLWVEHRGTRYEDTYLYYDYGVDYFDDFTHDLDFESAFDNLNGLGHVWVLSNIVNDVRGIALTANEKCLNVRLYRHNVLGNIMKVFYHIGGGGEGDTDVWDGPLSNTRYYMRIVKSGVDVYFGIYSTNVLRDAGDGTDGDVDNLSLTLALAHKFRYIFAVNTWNDGNANFMNYDVYNLYIGRMGGAFGPDGYFTTVDYLSEPIVNGSTLVLMTNTTIPVNTAITVEISNDNATWFLNDWEPMFGGFESIDLRVLNYSIGAWFRYNLSTTDGEVTPRIYQSRLITTLGNSTGGGSIITEYKIYPLFLYIIITIMVLVIGVSAWKK